MSEWEKRGQRHLKAFLTMQHLFTDRESQPKLAPFRLFASEYDGLNLAPPELAQPSMGLHYFDSFLATPYASNPPPDLSVSGAAEMYHPANVHADAAMTPQTVSSAAYMHHPANAHSAIEPFSISILTASPEETPHYPVNARASIAPFSITISTEETPHYPVNAHFMAPFSSSPFTVSSAAESRHPVTAHFAMAPQTVSTTAAAKHHPVVNAHAIEKKKIKVLPSLHADRVQALLDSIGFGKSNLSPANKDCELIQPILTTSGRANKKAPKTKRKRKKKAGPWTQEEQTALKILYQLLEQVCFHPI